MTTKSRSAVTPNQIVAYNMARYRKAAGLTQEELGNRLRGWTAKPWGKAGVSAVERSWDGKRLRQFDADLLFGLAVALDVPVMAFFLPPETSDAEPEFAVEVPHAMGSTEHEMYEYVRRVLPEPTETTEPAMEAYRERLASVLAEYRDGSLTLDMDDVLTERKLSEQIDRLCSHHKALGDVASDIEKAMATLQRRLSNLRDSRSQDGGVEP